MKPISTYIQEDFKLSHNTSVHNEYAVSDDLLHYVCDNPERYELLFNDEVKHTNANLMTIRYKQKDSSDSWTIEYFVTDPKYNSWAHTFFNDIESIRKNRSRINTFREKWNVEYDESDKYKWTYRIKDKKAKYAPLEFSIFVNMKL